MQYVHVNHVNISLVLEKKDTFIEKKQNVHCVQCLNFRTIYEGQEASRNRDLVPDRQGTLGLRIRFLRIDSWAP